MKSPHLADPSPSPFESGIWGTKENPCPSERILAAHVDGQLDASRSEVVEAHLDGCADCARSARRVEGMSNLLRTWEARSRVEAPSRLSAAVLRTVAPEAAALRRESLRVSARAYALAASVVLAIGAGVAAAFYSPRVAELASREESRVWAGAVDAVDAVAPQAASLAFDFEGLRAVTNRGNAATSALLSAATPARPEPVATSLAAFAEGAYPPLPDQAATWAFVRYSSFLDTQVRVDEDVYIVYDRALPSIAAAPYARVRRLEAWYAERARRASEPVTLDPAAPGLSVLDVLPLPSAAEMPAFLARLPMFVEPASRRSGGLVVRTLPGRGSAAISAGAGSPADAGSAAGAGVADGDDVEDLASAVAGKRVSIRPDTSVERTSLSLDVAPTSLAILIPAGELLAGGVMSGDVKSGTGSTDGAGDRVVTEGLWLPASSVSRTVVLTCLPISRKAGVVGQIPFPTGLVAGPELRGLLAYRADRDGVIALVDGQVTDAALDRGLDGRTSLLALYDRSSPDIEVAKGLAKEFASRFADGTAGFVVSDPNGRFQGLEHTAFRGAARRTLLERLLVGYLVESRTRTSIDAPRSGVAVEVALARLAERAPWLATTASTTRLHRGGGVPAAPGRPAPAAAGTGGATPTHPVPSPTPSQMPHRLSGEDPRSGLRLEGVPGEPSKPPLVSGLVPGIR